MSRLNHKRGRKSNYVKSLNTDDWAIVRRRILARDRVCQICGSILFLEVHHLTYEHKGNEINHLSDLILLCSVCHETVHTDFSHKFNPKNHKK